LIPQFTGEVAGNFSCSVMVCLNMLIRRRSTPVRRYAPSNAILKVYPADVYVFDSRQRSQKSRKLPRPGKGSFFLLAVIRISQNVVHPGCIIDKSRVFQNAGQVKQRGYSNLGQKASPHNHQSESKKQPDD
jgi:hypothetical protein